MVPLSSSRRHALLFGGHDVERHDRQHRAVHGHRNRHLAERDLVEEDLHVLDRIDGHAGLADVARHALVVGIVAAMRGQVEGHREALLPGGEIAPVEGVGFLGGGEARRTGGWSTAAWRTWWSTARAGRAARRRRSPGAPCASRSAAVYQGFTAMRSAVIHDAARRRPAARGRRSRLRAGSRSCEKSGLMRYSSIPSRSCHRSGSRRRRSGRARSPARRPPAAPRSGPSDCRPRSPALSPCGQTSCASARYSGSELHSTIRSASGARVLVRLRRCRSPRSRRSSGRNWRAPCASSRRRA